MPYCQCDIMKSTVYVFLFYKFLSENSEVSHWKANVSLFCMRIMTVISVNEKILSKNREHLSQWMTLFKCSV